MHILRLSILSIFIISSFYFFNHFIDLPFEANSFWNKSCWIGFTIVFFIVFFFFNDFKTNFSAKIAAVRLRKLSTNILVFTDLLLNSIFVTFFVFVLSAYFTMYFAKTTFTENVTIIRLECDEHFKGKYESLPAYTHLRFEDDETLNHYTLTFRDNICNEKPKIADHLPGKKAMLSGRKSMFGKFYEGIQLI